MRTTRICTIGSINNMARSTNLYGFPANGNELIVVLGHPTANSQTRHWISFFVWSRRHWISSVRPVSKRSPIYGLLNF